MRVRRRSIPWRDDGLEYIYDTIRENAFNAPEHPSPDRESRGSRAWTKTRTFLACVVGTTRAGRARGITSPFTNPFLLRSAISNNNCLGGDATGATCVDSASPGVPIQDWDVSGITDFSSLFNSKLNFNGNISAWNVSAATTMRNMLSDCNNFNGDISGWNVAKVEDMRYMFAANYVFDQDISGWNVAAVTNMDNMFREASAFNQDISGWNVAAVTIMDNMFEAATVFNQDISGWNVTAVKSADDMFATALAFNKDITSWNMATIKAQGYEGTKRMFKGATAWLAAFSSVSPTVRTDGPPSLWVNGSAPSAPAGPPGAPGAPGAAIEDFPEWGVALVALSLALSTITSAVVILRALCAPKIVYPAERV